MDIVCMYMWWLNDVWDGDDEWYDDGDWWRSGIERMYEWYGGIGYEYMLMWCVYYGYNVMCVYWYGICNGDVDMLYGGVYDRCEYVKCDDEWYVIDNIDIYVG